MRITNRCSCSSRKLARRSGAEKKTSSDVHEAMTRWVQSGTHVVPEYPCHNPAFRFFSLTTCRFVPYLLHPFLLLLCTKHVARTAIFSLTPIGNMGPMVASGRPRVGTHVPSHPPRATPQGGRHALSRPTQVCGTTLLTTLPAFDGPPRPPWAPPLGGRRGPSRPPKVCGRVPPTTLMRPDGLPPPRSLSRCVGAHVPPLATTLRL